MAVSISCSVCTKISPDGDIRRDQAGHRDNIAQAMPTKGSGDYRGTGLPGSYPYADKHTTEVQCVANHGIPEREK